VATLAAGALAISACTTAAKPAAGPSTTAAARHVTVTTTATQPTTTVLPVVDCPTSYADGNNSHPFVASRLPAATGLPGLSFYSNGLLTVLGPRGWTCSALVAGDGGQVLDVYLSGTGQSNLATAQITPGTEAIQLDGDYTGHGPGAFLVCSLFPNSAAAHFYDGDPPCPAAPANELDTQLTPDIVTFVDPAGVKGTGAGSGGSLTSLGAVVYPQVHSAASVNVAVLSCTLPATLAAVCHAIQADFLVREAPAFNGMQG
jgi:hypothetical protein